MAYESVMSAEDWFDNQLHPGSVSREGILSKAVAVSLVLHGLTFLVLLSVSFFPGNQEIIVPTTRESGITVTLVSRVEPLARGQTQQEQPLTVTAPASDDSRGPAEQTQTATIAESTAEIPDEIPDELSEKVPAIAHDAVADTTPTIEPGVPATAERATTLALVNTAITDYRNILQRDLNRGYVEDCMRYRNRHGPNSECPGNITQDHSGQQEEKALVDVMFANITRNADNARQSRKLERENALMKEIMEAGGPAGEQAEIRWRLNRQNHAYLNGNIVPQLTFMAQTAFVNDYNRTVTAVPFQFRCSEFPKPCEYTFTGFEIKRPPSYVEQTPSFVIRPPLFKPSQD